MADIFTDYTATCGYSMLRGNYFIFSHWFCSCTRSRTEVTPLICVASPNHRFVELKDANYIMGNSEQQQLNSSAFSKAQIAPGASIRILKRYDLYRSCDCIVSSITP